jgi:uracil-DNA glycosylase
LPPSLDPTTQQALAARLRFYRELGLTEFYRRPVDPALAQTLAASATSESDVEEPVAVAHAPGSQPSSIPSIPSNLEDQPIPPRKPIPVPPQISGIIPPAEHAAALQLIREDIGDCTRCALHKGRNKIVFADGDPQARLMFVGEGPGADEDAQGLPFVGRAGQLLNNMITAMGLKREEVYIANIVKCRPPGNRTPEPEEANTCSPFLFRQIDVVRPEVIVALGATAATYLLGQRQPLAGLRGRVHSLRGAQLIVTYHPAFLLRDPRQKKEAWADLQIAMRELGLKPPARV